MRSNVTTASIFNGWTPQVHSQYGISNPISDASVLPAASSSRTEFLERAKREAEIANSLIKVGNYPLAIVHLTEAAKLQPGNGSIHYSLACTNWLAGQLCVVEAHFATAFGCDPNNVLYHESFSSYCTMLGRIEQAIKHSEIAMKLAPERVLSKVAHIEALWAGGQFDKAFALLEPIILAGNGGAYAAVLYAKMASRFGTEEKALLALERELRSSSTGRNDRIRTLFASTTLLEKAGRYDEAFANARLANDKGARPFDADLHTQSISQRIAYYTSSQLGVLPRSTIDSSRTVLIVGMPRSGTTLVEQILATHPAVHGAGELMYLYDAVCSAERAEWAKGQLFPHCWNHLSLSRANELAGNYLGRVNALNSSAKYVTDKMPTNFLFLGTAELLLPQCKVIHCVRDPRDVALSCYFSDFASGNDFAFSTSHIARYYRDYARLMDHWKSVLKIPMLEVKYEDVVSDQAGQTERMLKFLNLPWEEQCLKPEQTNRPSPTASRDQVRRPIYSSSVGRWKHYEKHIPEWMALGAG